MVELLADILTERVASTARTDTPTAAIVRIRPQQVAHWTLVGHLLHAVLFHYVSERVDGRRETAVETENLFLYQGGERKVVKEVSEVFPHVGVAVLAQTLKTMQGQRGVESVPASVRNSAGTVC